PGPLGALGDVVAQGRRGAGDRRDAVVDPVDPVGATPVGVGDRLGHVPHHPSARASTDGSKPTSTRSSRVAERIGEPGTARRSRPGTKISLVMIIWPSAAVTSRTEVTNRRMAPCDPAG